MCLRMSLLVVLVLALGGVSADAKTIYVDNQSGADRADGLIEKPTNEFSGPVRTLKRAMQLVRPGDVINIANTGVPYYESISIVGKRLSGTGEESFRIVGNGSVLSGAHAVPETGWQKAGDDLWTLKPWRKGHYLLVLSGTELTEVRPDSGTQWRELPTLEVHQWCSFKGQIYYRSPEREEPHNKPFAFAGEECGISIYGARDVVIQDLTVQHFRLDGVSVPDLAKNIELRNVKLAENGRAGLRVGGAAVVTVRGGTFEKNLRHSVLVQGLGGAEVVESTLDVQPTFE